MNGTNGGAVDEVVELTRELIRFQSVNPPGNELPAAQYLAAWCNDRGIEASVEEVSAGRANVVARIKGNGTGHLVFTGHIDVVPPGGQKWEHDPFEADLLDGRIYGRGSADMKGGVAAIAVAMASLARTGFRPTADIILAATCGEEEGMLGAQAMVTSGSLHGAAHLVVAEPSNLDVFIGEKGVLWLTVRAFGRTGHGSMPWLGVNAVSYIARLIPQLEAYPFSFRTSDLLGDPTISANMIEGGNKINVVPDVCELNLDMRTVPSQDQDDLAHSVETLAREVAQSFHPELRVEVDVRHAVGSVETDRDEPLVEAMIASVSAIRGGAPQIGGVTYGTDAAYLGPGFNIPMVICGPGAQGMAHQPDEYVEIEQLGQAVEIYMDVAKRLVG